MKVSTLFFFVVFTLSVSLAEESYQNYVLLKITFQTSEQKSLLEGFRNSSNQDDFRFLLHGIPSNKNSLFVLVSPKAAASCLLFLIQNRFKLEVISDDFSKEIRKEARANTANMKRAALHTYYMRYDQINSFIMNKARSCRPPLVCNVVNVGTSYEGRNILLLEVYKSNRNKPYMHVDAGIHAREWIAPAAALYFLDTLVSGVNSDLNALLENFNFYIIPLLNPDGYEYSFTMDRLWRKNRKPSSNSCFGVDLNRNFGYQWGASGTSTDPCDETYGGTGAFTEPESQLLGSFIRTHSRQIKLYLTLHSYGQNIAYTYGYREGTYPPTYPQMKEAGLDASQAISQITGSDYQVGNDADMLYPAAGGSDDYATYYGVPFAYTIELADQGDSGFLLPPSNIPNNGLEVTQMVIKIGTYIANNFVQ